MATALVWDIGEANTVSYICPLKNDADLWEKLIYCDQGQYANSTKFKILDVDFLF